MPDNAPQSSNYRSYLLTLLMVILGFNFMDRIALGVVLQNLQSDLHLSDTQLGFLSGIAFAFFYAVMGVPIARWADRGNRITIVAVTTALWSAAVAACGLATSFLQLLAIRIAVAVGEAGCIPPAHSLIADYFSRAERPRAVARYMLGAPLAVIVGSASAGWLNQWYGWRVTFVAIGLPGIVLAAIALFTLKENRRLSPAVSKGVSSAAGDDPGIKSVILTLAANSAFRHLLLGYSVWYFFGNGLLQWVPAFFMRAHGLASGELGSWLALVNGAAMLLGVYWGGEWSSRRAANNERLQLIFVASMALFYIAFYAAALLVSNYYVAFALIAIGSIGGNMSQGPLLATMQTLVPSRMRATALAFVYFIANLIGMGFGPLAVGALSDALYPTLGTESLRYALLACCSGYIWMAWHIWRASRTVARDVATTERQHEESTHGQLASVRAG